MNTFELLNNFKIVGNVISVQPFGNGHINKTYKVITDTDDKYLFQAVSTVAFKNIDDLMRNIYIVTTYLENNHEKTMEIIKTKNNKLYYKEGEFYYRVYQYVRKSTSYEALDSMEKVEKVAEAFAQFHKNLSGLDPCLIAETIPNFHNTPKRFSDLMDVLSEDPMGRAEECSDLIPFILKYKKQFSQIQKGLDDGSLPERLSHNDPKINNVLFSRDTDEILCIVDLDTVMPGTCLYDFGDGLRSLFTGDNESSEDLTKLKVDLKLYEIYTKSYLKEMKDVLTDKEKELLPYSVFTITMELGMRFLKDYLEGDIYFKIKREDENLIRARAQFALAKDILINMPKLKEITNEYAK